MRINSRRDRITRTKTDGHSQEDSRPEGHGTKENERLVDKILAREERVHDDPPFSLWDYLREELLATDFDSHQELKWERVSNLLRKSSLRAR